MWILTQLQEVSWPVSILGSGDTSFIGVQDRAAQGPRGSGKWSYSILFLFMGLLICFLFETDSVTQASLKATMVPCVSHHT